MGRRYVLQIFFSENHKTANNSTTTKAWKKYAHIQNTYNFIIFYAYLSKFKTNEILVKKLGEKT